MDKIDNNPVEELAFIKNIIKDSRERFYDNGVHLILWGLLVAVGQFSNYITIKSESSQYLGYIWTVLVAIGWISGIVIGKRERREFNTDNYANRVTTALWIGGGISMSIVGFSFGMSGLVETRIISPMAINPVISIILGALYFTTGALYEMKWLSRLAYGWWLTAVIFFIWVDFLNFLVFGVIVIALMVVPGMILFKNYREIKRAESGV